jgi:hypothetical protein
MAKRKRTKEHTTIYKTYTKNLRSSNTNPTENYANTMEEIDQQHN